MFKNLANKAVQYFCNKHIELLREARKKIDSGEFYFVCAAVRNEQSGLVQRLAGWNIRRMIKNSLFPWHTVDMWVSKAAGGLPIEYDPRVYRLAWIDWMIEGWENLAKRYPVTNN